MSADPDSPSIWRLQEQIEQLGSKKPFAELAEFGDAVSVELYRPVETDNQKPHTRAELYIVATGQGQFHLAGRVLPFSAGDMIYVPAHYEHRFEDFSDDFSTWVIFFGAEKPKP